MLMIEVLTVFREADGREALVVARRVLAATQVAVESEH